MNMISMTQHPYNISVTTVVGEYLLAVAYQYACDGLLSKMT